MLFKTFQPETGKKPTFPERPNPLKKKLMSSFLVHGSLWPSTLMLTWLGSLKRCIFTKYNLFLWKKFLREFLFTKTPSERWIHLKHVVAFVVDGNHVVAIDWRRFGRVLDGAVFGEQFNLNYLVVDFRVRFDETTASDYFICNRQRSEHGQYLQEDDHEQSVCLH